MNNKLSRYNGRPTRVHKRCGGYLKKRKLTVGFVCKKCNELVEHKDTIKKERRYAIKKNKVVMVG